MADFTITREQLDELKEKAAKLRQEPAPDISMLASISYEIEQLVAEVEAAPDEATYGDAEEMTDEDDDDEE